MTNEFNVFAAGWAARREYDGHEWGPQPPSTPELAYKQWKNTCVKGHLTFVIALADHKRIKCDACNELLKRGEFK